MKDGSSSRRDLLSLLETQRLEESGTRHDARVSAEQAGHIRPDLQPAGLQLGGEVCRGRVRAAAAQQHNFPLEVAGDKTLRQQQRPLLAQSLLQVAIRFKSAGRGKVPRPLILVRKVDAMQNLPRVDPVSRQPLILQESGSQPRGHEFAERHHFGLHPRTDLPHEAHAGQQLVELADVGRQ